MKSQIAFENVIILYTRYIELMPTMFDMDIDGNLTGQRAVFFRDGIFSDLSQTSPSYWELEYLTE
jgi:hypothetical protein